MTKNGGKTCKSSKKIALEVALVTISINFLLSAFKLIAGILGKSSAMISDAVHSASDVISTIIVIIGVVISSKPLDKNHPYGHERLECISAIVLSVILCVTGCLIAYNGIESLVTGAYKNIAQPTLFALIASIISIAVKEAMFWYTYIVAKKINSLSLKADAWHHRSDALSSIGSLVGIGATMIFNMPIFDVIASLCICIFILKVSISIFVDTVNKLVDKSCPDDVVEKMKEVILSINGVMNIDLIKTRIFGNKIYVDIEIGAYKKLTLEQAHSIAEEVHSTIEHFDKNIKHCMVHVNPKDDINFDHKDSETI